MRKTALSMIDQLPNGTPLECIEGQVTKIGKRYDGTNAHGEWSFQTVTLKGDGTTVNVKLKNREPFQPSYLNARVLITHGTNPKNNKPCGLEAIDEDKDGQPVRVIQATRACDISLVEGTAQAAPQTQQRQSQQQGNYQQQRPSQQGNTQAAGDVGETKRLLARISTLYTMAYDASVAQAFTIYERHGYALPPGTIGIVADKFFMEAIRRTDLNSLPFTPPEPRGKPLADLIPLIEHQFDTILDRQTRVQEQAKAHTTPKPTPKPKELGPDETWDEASGEIRW